MTGIIVTPFITVFFGIVVFIVGQFFVVLFLERIRIQARCVEDIAQTLGIYADVFSSIMGEGETADRMDNRSKATSELRRLSALLRSTVQTLGWYKFWQNLGLVISGDDVVEASKQLIFLSNSCHIHGDPEFSHMHLMEAVSSHKAIERLLGIQVEPSTMPEGNQGQVAGSGDGPGG